MHADDSFLIHLMYLSETNLHVDASIGDSSLTALQIRNNVDLLNGDSGTSSFEARNPPLVISVSANEPERNLFTGVELDVRNEGTRSGRGLMLSDWMF